MIDHQNAGVVMGLEKYVKNGDYHQLRSWWLKELLLLKRSKVSFATLRAAKVALLRLRRDEGILCLYDGKEVNGN